MRQTTTTPAQPKTTPAAAKKPSPKERGRAIEAQVHAVMRDRTLAIEDRAEQGLTLLTTKLTEDLEAQYAHICDLESHKDASAVDAEVCRLLRMMEKRRKLFDKLEAALTTAPAG